MRKTILSFVLSSVMFGTTLALVSPVEVLAQAQDESRGLVDQSCQTDVTKCDFCAFMRTGNNVLAFLFQILVIAAVILIVIAGAKLVTSGGNVSAKEQAKSMLTNAIIGFVIVLSAWFIVDTLMKMLVNPDSGYGVWKSLTCPDS